MMPVQQTCPICRRIFAGSDCIGQPCEQCSSPIWLREIEMPEEACDQIDNILKNPPNPIVEPKAMPEQSKVEVQIYKKATITTSYSLRLKPEDIIRLLKYENIEVPTNADFDTTSDYEISNNAPLLIKWEKTSYE